MMLKIIKNKWPLWVGGGLMALSSQVMSAPTVSIEAPAENATITGIIQVFGWAIDPASVTSVKLYIDGTASTEGVRIGAGGERSDVEAANPGVPDAQYSGFSTALNAALFSNGPHTITIEAINANGELTSVSRTIQVSNPPGKTSVRDSIDLSQARGRVSGQSIFLEGAILNGRSYPNLELGFDSTTNGFHLVGFKDDLDGDGYHDDDKDRDGYHDDDQDRDGFPDSDDNGNDSDDNSNDSDDSAPSPISSSSNATKGKQIFASTCAASACHGPNPATNQNDILEGEEAGEISEAIRENKGGMGFLSGVLSTVDIEDLRRYLGQFE